MPLLPSLRQRLAALRRLAQPFFLPLRSPRADATTTDDSAAPLALLLGAMLAVVLGVGLLLLSALVGLAELGSPGLLGGLLPGFPARLAALWRGPWAALLLVLATAGLGCFLA